MNHSDAGFGSVTQGVVSAGVSSKRGGARILPPSRTRELVAHRRVSSDAGSIVPGISPQGATATTDSTVMRAVGTIVVALLLAVGGCAYEPEADSGAGSSPATQPGYSEPSTGSVGPASSSVQDADISVCSAELEAEIPDESQRRDLCRVGIENIERTGNVLGADLSVEGREYCESTADQLGMYGADRQARIEACVREYIKN